VTTVVDMPLNSIPPTLDVRAMLAKQACAKGVVYVDTGFWGGAVPGNLAELAALHDAGVLGFKCFLVPSGVAEFDALGGDRLLAAMREVAQLGSLMLVHAEAADVLAAAPTASGPQYADYLASRPVESETVAVARLVDLAELTGARTHIVHVSSGAAADLIGSAQRRGVPITGETCPHYLTLAAEDVPDGACAYKCCPPIRGRAEQDRLWAALLNGSLAMIVSDHSPCPADLKRLETGDFASAWGGIASLQLGLPLIWTAAQNRGVDLASVMAWMAAAPADLVGLTHKGRIEVGADADLVAFAPDETWIVDPAALHHRHAVTPYAGRELTGAVRRTWLRGIEIDRATPRGRLLQRATG
jgi:allantoinase